jgi:ribonucleoside-triphosphate reductase
VADKVDPFTKIDFEALFHWISSGGHISYCEFPPMANNLEGLESVIDYAMDKLDYFGVNTPADKCLDCGAEVESKHTAKGYVCPICESTNVNATRRICGYLGSINIRPTNPGKAQEFELRVKHC